VFPAVNPREALSKSLPASFLEESHASFALGTMFRDQPFGIREKNEVGVCFDIAQLQYP
jgi:hypothetical protein